MFEQEVQLYFMNDEHCPMNKRKFREEFCSFFYREYFSLEVCYSIRPFAL